MAAARRTFCSTSNSAMPRSRIRASASKISFTTIGARPSDGSSTSRSRRSDQSAADRQHLLLAAGQRPAELAAPFAGAETDRTPARAAGAAPHPTAIG